MPGAEDLQSTRHLAFVRDIMRSVGGYVPDFVAAERAAVLELEARDGRSYQVGVSICYDGAFDDPFTLPARSPALDFHLIASNEAWYEDSVEMEHMLAFARTMAVATGRSIVRATNSGISCVIDPEGRERVALAVGGQRRMVRGTLVATVPVPVRKDSTAPGTTPYARTGAWHWVLWLLLIAGSLAYAWRFEARGRLLPAA